VKTPWKAYTEAGPCSEKSRDINNPTLVIIIIFTARKLFQVTFEAHQHRSK